MTTERGLSNVKTKVPLSEMFGYTTDIRNRTQGEGNFAILAQNIAAK